MIRPPDPHAWRVDECFSDAGERPGGVQGRAPLHRREREPDSPLRWPDWWILLTATTHPVYLLAIAPKISRFITGGQR